MNDHTSNKEFLEAFRPVLDILDKINESEEMTAEFFKTSNTLLEEGAVGAVIHEKGV